MSRKIAALGLALLAGWACATWRPVPPSFHIDSLPPGSVSALTLEQRIMLEEAWTRVRRGEAKGAERLFLRLGPSSPFYEAGLGYVALLQGQVQAAEGYFQDSIRKNPAMTISHIGLAQLYQQAGRMESAFNQYMEVLKNEPENAWALKESGSIRERQTDDLLREGVALYEQGQVEAAKEAFNKALHYSPRSRDAHLNLGRLYLKERQPDNALVHLSAAASLDPRNEDVLREYADALLQAGQLGKSLDTYEKLLELDPRNKDYKSRAESLKNRLGIFELPSQYDLIAASAAVTRQDAAALIAIRLKDNLQDSGTKPPVIIDIATSWASKFILKVAALGVMEVYANHTFEPQRVMTRAEMAEAVLRLVQVLDRPGARKFIRQFPPELIRISDVSADNVYFQTIAEVVSLELMELGPDKSFRPDQPLTGREAVRIIDLIRALSR